MANAFRSAKIPLNTLKIPLVADNAAMRRLLKSMIEKIADAIHEANNGRDAVAVYQEERPDWVLMDVYMKPTDGLVAAATIKGMDSQARTIC